MNSCQRVEVALNHQQPDRVPLDLGAMTGMHVSSVYKLRQALKLDLPGTPVKVTEVYPMLGEIAADLQEALGVDVVGLGSPNSFFGFQYKDWKPWTTFDGTPVLVPGGFNTDPEPNGDILMYPEGDRSVPPSGRMPKGGFYLDAIVRQEPIDDAKLNIEDNLQEFSPISDEMLQYFASEADRLRKESDRAILANFGGTSFGDIALVPAPWLKNPKGIRDIAEWYISTVTRFAVDDPGKLWDRDHSIAVWRLCRAGRREPTLGPLLLMQLKNSERPWTATRWTSVRVGVRGLSSGISSTDTHWRPIRSSHHWCVWYFPT